MIFHQVRVRQKYHLPPYPSPQRQSPFTKMKRNGLRVSLVEHSTGKPYPRYKSASPFPADRPSVTNVIAVPDGDMLKLEVVVSETFDWGESDFLQIRIHLAKSGVEFRLRPIPKPGSRRRLVEYFDLINAWDAEQQKWTSFSPQFCDMKVSV